MTISGTPAQVKTWVEGTRPHEWYGQCAGLTMSICRHFGYIGNNVPYPSAWAAYKATSIESKDYRKAPVGAIHYWDYTDAHGNRYGHVAVDMYGAGARVLSATNRAVEYWGNSAGLISVKDQTIPGLMKYMGWSRFYGKSYYAKIVLPIPPKPAPDPAPEPPKRKKNTTMFLSVVPKHTKGQDFLFVTGDNGIVCQFTGAQYRKGLEEQFGGPAAVCTIAVYNQVAKRFGQPIQIEVVNADT